MYQEVKNKERHVKQMFILQSDRWWLLIKSKNVGYNLPQTKVTLTKIFILLSYMDKLRQWAPQHRYVHCRLFAWIHVD